ncbi:MAG: hypothetical protein Q8908_16355, partial [Bacteroidota bacterium]|nr:hypothetical protein [Bacteroidota bacterium]
TLGKNVFLFDPQMNMKDIQNLIDTIYAKQVSRGSEFNENRFALLFKPGKYNLDIKVGYYMHILGLGENPEDVIITGAVRSKSTHKDGHVLTNFWREAENLTVIPTVEPANVWAVSQAAALRRIYIKGDLQLHDNGYSSGGFLADSKIEGTVIAGSQQQWFTRDTELQKWTGGSWNLLFMGVPGAPASNWPKGPVTTLEKVPAIREKPYLIIKQGKFFVKIPDIKLNTSGPGWLNGHKDKKTVSLEKFYIVKPGCIADSINLALQKGRNLLFTPGIYKLDKSIQVTRPGTIITGLGMATLMPTKGNLAMEVSDIDNVTICGLLFEAGKNHSETLLQVGKPDSHKDHAVSPTLLSDVFFRVGGATEGSANSCLTINSNNVCVDHTWLWRADHGNGVGWDRNKCANGLIVNGDHVLIYGLFNEHFQEYQTLWNGNHGRLYFYQSEMPYDPANIDAWKHDGIGGYASYKVSDKVTTHEAWGLGIYCYFPALPMIMNNAIETPQNLENDIHHKMILWLNGNKESKILNIINDKGGSVSPSNRSIRMERYKLNGRSLLRR